ncbi:MAG: nucleotide triphosphate diphosphatase NUDT15 [Candidatus Nanoarchaeia archaeon]
MQRPFVGVGVIVRKNGRVLLGKRKSSHGEGTWCFPGGHLEYGEDIEDCAKRETKEETGIEIQNLKRAGFTNDIFGEKHYVTLFIVSDYLAGEVQLKEPDKCEKWEWFSWDALPEPLFLPVKNLLKQEFNPFE